MPIITVDTKSDDYIYDFDSRSKNVNVSVKISVTDEEYEQLVKMRDDMNKFQDLLRAKHKEALELNEAFEELHKPPVVQEEDINDASGWKTEFEKLYKEKLYNYDEKIHDAIFEYESWSKKI